MQVYDWEKLEKEIIDWHAKTFPDATMEGQLIKLEEEMNKNKARTWAKTAEGTYHHTNKE